MSGHRITLTIVPESDHFERCHAAVTDVAKRLGFDAEQEYRLAVCVSEAYTNAFVHGNRSDPTKAINLVFAWDEEVLRVDIEDAGEGKLGALCLDDSRPDIDHEKSGGRGVGIMKRLADNIKVEERPEGGLRVSLSFRLRRKSSQVGVLLLKSNGGTHGNQSN